MLEDFDLGDSSAFLDELEAEDAAEPEELPPPPPVRKRRSSTPQRIFGMTPIQLFVISVEVFFMICILGAFLMMVTEKMMFL